MNNTKRSVRHAVECLESRLLLAAVSWDGGPTGLGTQWTDPLNWSTDSLPGPADDVVLFVPGSPSITLDSGTQSINSLTSDELLTINGGTLKVAAGISISADLALNGGTISGGTLTTTGAAQLIIQSGTLDQATLDTDLTVPTGATLDVTNGLTITTGYALTLNSVGGDPSVFFDGTQTLSGGGEVFFTGTGSANNIFARGDGTQAGAATLTIGSGITIDGSQSGTIGGYYAYDTIINQATINADASGKRIMISGGNSASWTNAGVLKASNGGELFIAGILDSTGRTLTLDSAGGFIRVGTIHGGVLAGTVNLSFTHRYIFDGVTLDTDLTAPNGAIVQFNNGLTITTGHTLTLGSANGYVQFFGTQTLCGGGDVFFASPSNIFVAGNGTLAATLTIGSGITIHGSENGKIGCVNAYDTIINQGTIIADTAGKAISISGGRSTSWTNTGQLKVSNGGTLSLNGVLDNTGRTLTLDATGGSILLGATIKGGVLAGLINFPAFSTTLDGVTLDGDMTLADGSQLHVKNGLTITAGHRLTLASSGNFTDVLFDGTQTLSGNGEVFFSGSSSRNIIYANGDGTLAGAATLTIGSGITIHGSQGGTIVADGIYDTIINQGTINADAPGMTITVGASNRFWTNSGVLKTSNGGLLAIAGLLNNIGPIGGSGGSVPIFGTIKGGVLSGTNNFFVFDSNTVLDGVTLDTDLTVLNGQILHVKDGLTITAGHKLTVAGASIYVEGTQTLSGNGQVFFAGDSPTNAIFVRGDNTQAGAVTLTIGSGVTIHGSQSGNISGFYIYDTIINQGTISADTPGKTITFSNHLSRLINEGTLSASAGATLRVLSDLALDSTSVFQVYLGSASSFGSLAVTGTATLSGTLHVSYSGTYRPPAGAIFDVLTAGSISGTFSTTQIDNGTQAPLEVSYPGNVVRLTAMLAAPTRRIAARVVFILSRSLASALSEVQI